MFMIYYRVIQIMTEWADRFPLTFANDKQLTTKFENWVDELKKQREAEKKEKRSKDRATVASKIDFAPFFAATAKLVRSVCCVPCACRACGRVSHVFCFRERRRRTWRIWRAT
jgi:hypothetical protein